MVPQRQPPGAGLFRWHPPGHPDLDRAGIIANVLVPISPFHLFSMRRLIVIASALLLLTLLGLPGRRAERVKPVALIPTLTGKVEYCLTCHSDLPEISKSHPVKTFGCVICHGGEPLALDANLAHSTMRGGANPADFSVVQASCGGANCHSGTAASFSDHIQRATTSIQATYAGAIAIIRYTLWRPSQPEGPLRCHGRAGPAEHQRHHQPGSF